MVNDFLEAIYCLLDFKHYLLFFNTLAAYYIKYSLFSLKQK